MAFNILVFGASTTYGAWDPEGGWVARLRKFLDEDNIKNRLNDYQINLIYNLGISDETSQNILDRLDTDCKPRLWKDALNVFIFEVGKNDALFNNNTQTIETPIKKFEENLKSLIKKARQYCQKIIFVGSFPVDKRVDPMPWNKSCSYKNEDIKKYNQSVKKICQEEEIPFIDIYQNFADQDFSIYLQDGIHPNSAGHQIIFEKVKSFFLISGILSGIPQR